MQRRIIAVATIVQHDDGYIHVCVFVCMQVQAHIDKCKKRSFIILIRTSTTIYMRKAIFVSAKRLLVFLSLFTLFPFNLLDVDSSFFVFFFISLVFVSYLTPIHFMSTCASYILKSNAHEYICCGSEHLKKK